MKLSYPLAASASIIAALAAFSPIAYATKIDYDSRYNMSQNFNYNYNQNYNQNQNTNQNYNYNNLRNGSNYYPPDYNYFYPTPASTTTNYYKPNNYNYGNYNNYSNYSNNGYLFETNLYGSQENPSRPNDVSGSGGVWFGNNGKDMNYWLYTWSGQEKVTAAHLHCGDPSENGPVVATFFNGSARTVSGELARGYLSDDNIQSANCRDTIGYDIHNLSDLARAIREGRIYINIHTERYPDGAARGQLGMTSSYNYYNPNNYYYGSSSYNYSSAGQNGATSAYATANTGGTWASAYASADGNNTSHSWNGWSW